MGAAKSIRKAAVVGGRSVFGAAIGAIAGLILGAAVSAIAAEVTQPLGVFASNDVATVVGIGIVFLGQWFAFRRWLHDRDAVQQKAQEERTRQFARVDDEFKLVYKEIGDVRLQLATALGELPKRAEIEHIVELRISPLINATKEQAQTFSRLTVELARVGATMPHRRHDDAVPAGG